MSPELVELAARIAVLPILALATGCGARTSLEDRREGVAGPERPECSYAPSGDPYLLVAEVDLVTPRLAWTGQALLVAAQAGEDISLCELDWSEPSLTCQPRLPSLTLGDLSPGEGGAALCAGGRRGGEHQGPLLWELSAGGAPRGLPTALPADPDVPGSTCLSLEWTGEDHLVSWCPRAQYPECTGVAVQRRSLEGEARGALYQIERGCLSEFPEPEARCFVSLPAVGADRGRGFIVTTLDGLEGDRLVAQPLYDDAAAQTILEVTRASLRSPSVAVAPDQGAAILWVGARTGGGADQSGLFMTLLDEELSPLSTTLLTSQWPAAHRLLATPAGFLAVWVSRDSTAVLARQVGTRGDPLGEELVVLDASAAPFDGVVEVDSLFGPLDATTGGEDLSVAVAVVEASTARSLIAVQRLSCAH